MILLNRENGSLSKRGLWVCTEVYDLVITNMGLRLNKVSKHFFRNTLRSYNTELIYIGLPAEGITCSNLP